jgi:putative salt-induced outer membrane protein
MKYGAKYALFFHNKQEDTILKLNAIKLSAVALSCLVGSSAFAQAAKADGQWRGTGGAALSLTSGNTSSTNFLLNTEAARATDADKISLGAGANYGRSKDPEDGTKKTLSQKWNMFGQYDYNINSSVYVFGKLGLEGDKLSQLSLRTALAGGVGYKIINTPEDAFSVFGGVAYITDKYSERQKIGDKIAQRFSRVSLLLGEESSHTLSSTVSFKQRLELYPGVSGDSAMLMKFNAGLAVAMSSKLSLNVGFTDNYNSKPPVGNKKNDMGLFTGVNVKFGAM